jgi:hypothetical protein
LHRRAGYAANKRITDAQGNQPRPEPDDEGGDDNEQAF